LWPPQRGVGLREPNLGKTNPCVSPLYLLAICFTPSWGLVYISNANPACSCVYICKFQFHPIHPPSRRLSPCQSRWAPSRHGVFRIDYFDGCCTFFFVCVGRFAKNHRPFIIFLYDDICCTYFDGVLFCHSLNCCRYMPPAGLVGLCGRVVQQSCWARAW
jgi:hypothetical protein